jgi:hypothetical protein
LWNCYHINFYCRILLLKMYDSAGLQWGLYVAFIKCFHHGKIYHFEQLQVFSCFVMYIPSVVQSSLPWDLRTFSCSPTETLYPLNTTSLSSPLSSLWELLSLCYL